MKQWTLTHHNLLLHGTMFGIHANNLSTGGSDPLCSIWVVYLSLEHAVAIAQPLNKRLTMRWLCIA
ncbi:hypothetical protein VXQ92_01420 [Acinetobacter sp. 228]